jgi:nucleoside-diphosphate-sugar epimerase
LRSAQAHGPSIKNITFVGSVNAVTDGSAQSIANRVITNEDWISYTAEDARTMQNSFISYCVAKKEAEKGIWDFVERIKPHFSVTVILPTLIIGPALHFVDDLKKINLTNDIIYSYINGTNERIPPTPFPGYVGLRFPMIPHNVLITAGGRP